jgi:hypothetical protein
MRNGCQQSPAFFTHSLSVRPVPPIFAAVEVIAASRLFEQN